MDHCLPPPLGPTLQIVCVLDTYMQVTNDCDRLTCVRLKDQVGFVHLLGGNSAFLVSLEMMEMSAPLSISISKGFSFAMNGALIGVNFSPSL